MADSEKVLVTGATGFIGTFLVARLLERGEKVRALYRRMPSPPPPGLELVCADPLHHPNCELVNGDILDPVSLTEAMRGCDRVFHVAAYAKNWAPEADTFYQMNVVGMRNVFDAATAAGVRKIVWTSTCVTSGPSFDGRILDESLPRTTTVFYTEYERTKTMAENEALERAARGLPVVIVKPTRVFGPGRMTEGNSATRVIDDYRRGKMPFLLNFGKNIGNWAFVNDVAEGHIAAMEFGRIGQCYLLGGENASLRELFDLIDQLTGRRQFRIPLKCVLPIVFAWTMQVRARWFGTHPPITPGWVRTFCLDWPYRCDKAVGELGYRITPLRDALAKTLRWLEMIERSQRPNA